jgi:hypothetical protein
MRLLIIAIPLMDVEFPKNLLILWQAMGGCTEGVIVSGKDVIQCRCGVSSADSGICA